MRIGAVVLHYRYWPAVNDTLDALAAQDHPIEHILVIDNASGDGSADRLRGRADIELVEADSNGGYAAGMNLGIELLQSRSLDAVLLLTHEAVLNPTGLSALASALEAHPDLGAVGPLLAWRDQPDRVYSAGVSFSPRSWSTHHIGANDPVTSWSDRGLQPADSLDGAAALIRRAAIDATGRISEDYFLYFEEADYFVRMRRAGWTVACIPAALAMQQPGDPPGALWVRNELRFLADNAPRRILAREVLRTTYHAVGDVLHGRGAGARDRVAGLAAFVSGRPAATLVGRR